jgi:hypothetical protein
MEPVVARRTVGVGISEIATGLERQEITIHLPGLPILQPQCAVPADGKLDQIVPHALPPQPDAGPRSSGGPLARSQDRETQALHLGRHERHPGSVDFVLIGIMALGIESLVVSHRPEHLDGEWSLVSHEMKGLHAGALTGKAPSRRTHQDIAPKPGYVGYDDSAPPSGNRIP